MAFAQSLLGPVRGIDNLFTSSGTRAQRRHFAIEHVCSVMRHGSQEQRSDENLRRNRSRAVLWSSGVDSKRNYSARRVVECMATTTHTVEMIHDGVKHVLHVPEDETILSVALEENLDVPHDCKLGVCMTCPAKLEKGVVDQSGGMLSDDVIEKGYALMCVAYPQSDCTIRIIPEEELLRLQLATANDA
ncbi:unnamed protein product [Calypogeia fissa]